MARLFLSYASADGDRVRPLVEALEADGHTVWWDREIKPGPSFDREIERAIAAADCVVVVWSAQSVESEWVRSEVEEGVRRDVLVPVLFDDVLPPLAYRRRQAANLTGWHGENDEAYAALLAGIEATAAAHATRTGAEAPVSQNPQLRRGRTRLQRQRLLARAGAAGAVVLGVALGAVLGMQFAGGGVAGPGDLMQFEVAMPQGTQVQPNLANPLAITADGQRLLFNVTGPEGEAFLLRDLADLAPRVVHQVATAASSLGSLWLGPDGEWLVFNDAAASTYKKVRLTGGSPVAVAPTGLPGEGGAIHGLSWGEGGDIVYANTAHPGLMRIPGGAGEAEPLTDPAEGRLHRDPRHLPGGQALAYVDAVADNQDDNRIRVRDLATGAEQELMQGHSPLVTTSGHMVFRRGNVLWAVAFDDQTLTTIGREVPVLEGVAERGLDVSANGTLAYIPEVGPGQQRELVWVALDDGAVEPVPLALERVAVPRLSPSGDRVAVMDIQGPNRIDLWTYHFTRQTTTRITFDEHLHVGPRWLPDGRGLLYSKRSGGVTDQPFALYRRAADGSPGETLVASIEQDVGVFAVDVTADGTRVILGICQNDDCSIGTIATDGGAEIEPLAGDRRAVGAAVSPDGQWLAFVDAGSVRGEVHVVRMDDPAGRDWRVSPNGGAALLWSPVDGALYYVEPSSETLMRVALEADADGGLVVSPPKEQLDLSELVWRGNYSSRQFEISKDGRRLLGVRQLVVQTKAVVVLNWFQQLQALVPADG